MFHPSEIEFTEVIERIRNRIDELRPARVVIDSLSELRHLAGEGPATGCSMEALKPSLLEHDSTVIVADGPDCRVRRLCPAHHGARGDQRSNI